MNKFYKELGKKMQEVRIDKGLTQMELAQKMNIARTTIASYEQGARHINIDDLMRMCEILDYDINEMVKDAKRYLL